MVSKSTPSPKTTTKKTCAIKRLHTYYRWLRLNLSKRNVFAYPHRQWRLLSLTSLYIFFRPAFEDKLSILLVDFKPDTWSFAIWCGFILITIVYTCILAHRRYIISEGRLSWTVVILAVWVYYRFIDTHYIATPTPISGICYVDLVPFLGVCVVVVAHYSYWKRTKHLQKGVHNSIRGFEVECPCTFKDNDLLGRRKEARDLAEMIFQTDTSNAAFTLGLTAPWGAGKTSFMLAMKDYLEKRHSDETILLDFNPWMYRKAPNLTQVFFEELSRTLAPYSSALASGFMQYVDYILSKENNTWIQLGARLLPQGFKAKSTREQYEFLKKEICKLGRKIVIFIDDVDRLDSEELIELFSLVRNISSFPNMSYILAYDKEYVTNQLQGKFDTQKNRYIEKILQEEYLLAKITPTQLYKALNEYLKRIGHVNLFSTIKASKINLEEHLPTIRSIKRVCNSILSLPQELNGNIELFDWFVLELIRIQYPKLFEFLKNNYMTAFIHQPNGHVITQINSTDPADLYAATQGAIDFGTYLHENQKSLELEKPSSILKLMGYLWERDREKKPKQVNDDKYIGIYFYRTLQEGDIRVAEFRQYLTLPIDETQRPPMKSIKPYIDQIYTYSQWPSFCEMAWQQDIKDIKETVNMLYVAFYIITLNGELELESEIKINNWINQIYGWEKREDATQILKQIFKSHENHKGVLLYISSILNHAEEVCIPFSLDELEAIKEKLFLEYTRNDTSIDPIDCYRLWHICQTLHRVEFGSTTGRQIAPNKNSRRMNKRMREIIVTDIEQLIPYFIQAPVSAIAGNKSNMYRLLLPYPIWTLNPEEVTDETTYLPKFISGLDASSPIIKEFQEFSEKWFRHIQGLENYLMNPGDQASNNDLSQMDRYWIEAMLQKDPLYFQHLKNNPQEFFQIIRFRAVYELGFIHFEFKNITPQDIYRVSLAEASPRESTSIEL